MEEMVLIFAIPAFFVTVCLTFLLLNNCYYRRKGEKNNSNNNNNNGKITANVSVLNISNIAKNCPPSPTFKQKTRKGLKILKCIRLMQGMKGKKMSFGNGSSADPPCYPSVIVLHANEANAPPPTYQSLFDNPYWWENRNEDIKQSPNHWLHPHSAYAKPTYPESATDSAVLYL